MGKVTEVAPPEVDRAAEGASGSPAPAPGGAAGAEPAREVGLDEFASITADVGAGVPLARSLEEAGLSPEAWDAARQTWLTRLAVDAQSGRLELGRTYASLARERGGAATARAARVRRKLAGALPVAPEHRIGRHARITAAAPPAVVSSAIAARAEPPPPPPPAGDEQTRFHTLGTASAPDPLPFRPAPPARRERPNRAPPPPVAEPVAPPESAPTTDPLGETGVFSLSDASMRPVLPFSGAGRRDDPRADAPDARRKTEVLAFDPPPAVPGPAAPSTARTKTEELPMVRRATERIELLSDSDLVLDEDAAPPITRDPFATTQTGLLDVPTVAALPFSPGPDAPDQAASAPRHGGLPFTSPEEIGERISRISLAEYAQICAAVRLRPDDAAAVGAQHGLDPEAWRALHVLWRARFSADAALHARWDALVVAFVSRGE